MFVVVVVVVSSRTDDNEVMQGEDYELVCSFNNSSNKRFF